jgi:hypothetical protein
MEAARGDFAIFENTFFKIWITHLTTQQTINFRGWVTEFSDQFSSTWNTENVYGRMDPLATFQNTQRQITLAFDVVSANVSQAQQNLNKINALISFLYPVYNESHRTSQNTLKAAPLVGLRWTNLAADPYDGTQLVGYLAGATYAPDLSQGSFFQVGERVDMMGSPDPEGAAATSAMIPKVVSLQLQYTVLHKHLTGWYASGGSRYTFGQRGALFPNAGEVDVPGAESGQVIARSGQQENNPIVQGAIEDITEP